RAATPLLGAELEKPICSVTGFARRCKRSADVSSYLLERAKAGGTALLQNIACDRRRGTNGEHLLEIAHGSLDDPCSLQLRTFSNRLAGIHRDRFLHHLVPQGPNFEEC